MVYGRREFWPCEITEVYGEFSCLTPRLSVKRESLGVTKISENNVYGRRFAGNSGNLLRFSNFPEPAKLRISSGFGPIIRICS